MSESSRGTTRRLLEDWVAQTARWLYRLPDAPGLICYGSGSHGHWALQAHDTAFAAFAMLPPRRRHSRRQTRAGGGFVARRAAGNTRSYTFRGMVSPDAGAAGLAGAWPPATLPR